MLGLLQVLFVSLLLAVIGSQTRTHESGMATISVIVVIAHSCSNSLCIKTAVGRALECFRPLQDR